MRELEIHNGYGMVQALYRRPAARRWPWKLVRVHEAWTPRAGEVNIRFLTTEEAEEIYEAWLSAEPDLEIRGEFLVFPS